MDATDPVAVQEATALLAESVHESIRGLVPYHADGYAAYLRAVLGAPAPMRTVLVRTVCIGSETVGTADWRVLPGELFLNGIAVASHARGMGLASLLMEDGAQLAKSMDIRRLGLDVLADNLVALNLYRRRGFVATGSTYWRHVDHAGADETSLQAIDWPVFSAHMQAYGFGDLTLRLRSGESRRVRQVGRKLRVPPGCPGVAYLAAALGADRVVTTTVEAPDDLSIAHSLRMSREVCP
ncbi:GNAT family N-acetyltransferase [Actinoplanes sp. NPDC051859]|uniref:GNAT family N-acetyltransferase n=1 Tax=Actinoplanes sp. NPDC051859 TaxID=3363909 RepID=UPI00378B9864